MRLFGYIVLVCFFLSACASSQQTNSAAPPSILSNAAAPGTCTVAADLLFVPHKKSAYPHRWKLRVHSVGSCGPGVSKPLFAGDTILINTLGIIKERVKPKARFELVLQDRISPEGIEKVYFLQAYQLVNQKK